MKLKSIHSSKPTPFLTLFFALVASVCPAWGGEAPKPNLPEILNVGDIDYVVEVKHLEPRVHKPMLEYYKRWDGHGAGLVKQVSVDLLKKHLKDREGSRPFIMIDDAKYEISVDEYMFQLPYVTTIDKGRYAVPMSGIASRLAVIDLRLGTKIDLVEILGPSVQVDGGIFGRRRGHKYEWTGDVLPSNEKGRSPEAWLFVNIWDQVSRICISSLCVKVPLDDPRHATIKSLGGAPVSSVADVRENELLCITEVTNGAHDSSWRRFSIKSMNWIEPGASPENRVQRASYSPNGKHIYGVDAGRGLIVSDAATGKDLADFKGIGAFINAETLGATFDPAGQVAAIANPYGEFVTLIDTSTLKVIQQFKTSVPSCGMVFDGEKRRAHLLETMLPYE